MVRFYVFCALSAVCHCLFGQAKDTVVNNELITFIEEPPVFKGDLTAFIKKHLKYPKIAPTDTLHGGVVIVTYLIDTSGITTEHQILKGLRKDFDEEAIKAVRLIRYEKPAMQRGKPIKVRYTVPVEFNGMALQVRHARSKYKSRAR